jgi:hypothetical protein
MRFFQALCADERMGGVHINLMPTAPLRKPGQIDDVLDYYFDKCAPAGYFGVSCSARISHPGVHYDVGGGLQMLCINATAPGFLAYTMLIGIGDSANVFRIYGGDFSIEHLFEVLKTTVSGQTPNLPGPWYEVEAWQGHDIDEWYEFWIAELAMEKMILQGRGRNAYSGRVREGEQAL